MRRFIFRSLITILTFIIGITAVTIRSILGPSTPPLQPPQHHQSIAVEISPIEFFEWRREKQLFPRGDEKAENQPSHTYRQLEFWNAAEESQSGQVDILFRLENHGNRPVDLMILAVGDFSISPDGQGTGSNKPLHKSTLLTERQNIGQQVIDDLAPGETREVGFTNFNLRATVDKYLGKQYGVLEPRELRVKIDVRTLDNRQVAQREARLRLSLKH